MARRRRRRQRHVRTDRERDTTTLIWLAFGTLWLAFLYLALAPRAEFSDLETVLMVILHMCNGIVCYYFGKQNGQNGGSGHGSVEKSVEEAEQERRFLNGES